jgi:hypothetical protein
MMGLGALTLVDCGGTAMSRSHEVYDDRLPAQGRIYQIRRDSAQVTRITDDTVVFTTWGEFKKAHPDLDVAQLALIKDELECGQTVAGDEYTLKIGWWYPR